MTITQADGKAKMLPHGQGPGHMTTALITAPRDPVKTEVTKRKRREQNTERSLKSKSIQKS